MSLPEGPIEGPAATREPAAVCEVCWREDVLGGCPQIGDGTYESVFECWRLGIERLRARAASLEKQLSEAKDEMARQEEARVSAERERKRQQTMHRELRAKGTK